MSENVDATGNGETWGDFVADEDGPTGDQLATVVKLAEEQVKLEDQVADLEGQLNKAKAALRNVSERDLPAAMSLAGIEDYTLVGGREVEVKVKIVASPTLDQKPAMMDWLTGHNQSDIIKHEVKLGFLKGEQDKVDRLLTWARANLPKQKIDDRQFVHPQTLDAFVREQMSTGVDLPDCFGVVVLKRSVISRPKSNGSFDTD